MITKLRKIYLFLALFSFPFLNLNASAEPEIIYGTDYSNNTDTSQSENTGTVEDKTIDNQQANLTLSESATPQDTTLTQNSTISPEVSSGTAAEQINTTESENPGLIVNIKQSADTGVSENNRSIITAKSLDSQETPAKVIASKMKLSDFSNADPEKMFSSFKPSNLSHDDFILKVKALKNFIKLNADICSLLSRFETEDAGDLTADDNQRIFNSLTASPLITQIIQEFTDADILIPEYFLQLQKFNLFPQESTSFPYKAPNNQPLRYYPPASPSSSANTSTTGSRSPGSSHFNNKVQSIDTSEGLENKNTDASAGIDRSYNH